MTSAVSIAAWPFAFSQLGLIDTHKFRSEAKVRGVQLGIEDLCELDRIGLLSPLLQVRERRPSKAVSARPGEVDWKPGRPSGGFGYALRQAFERGALVDPSVVGPRRDQPFIQRTSHERTWWNGYLYTPWQLMTLRTLAPVIATRRRLRRHGKADKHRFDNNVIAMVAPRMEMLHKIAKVVGAVEGRYQPTLTPDWVHLTNADYAEWNDYRESFDAAQAASSLDVDSAWFDQAINLLTPRPAMIEWERLQPFAKRSALDKVAGEARFRIDQRRAAEILLRFGDDANLTVTSGLRANANVGLQRDERGLNSVLADLGLSPQPGVLLAVEGAVEEWCIRQVWSHLGLEVDASLVQVITQRGGDRRLDLILTAYMPVLGDCRPDGWGLARPPTRVVSVTDPLTKGASKTLKHLKRVFVENIAGQGGPSSIADDVVEQLLGIEEWDGPCFEFAHFTDKQLATAINAIRPGATSINRVSEIRTEGRDINHAWSGSGPDPLSKLDLARELWPTMAANIDLALRDPSTALPAVARVALEARQDALNIKRNPWALPNATSPSARAGTP